MLQWGVSNIQNGLFEGCSQIGGAKRPPLPKICHTCPAMMKLGTIMLYIERIQKLYEPRDTPLEFYRH